MIEKVAARFAHWIAPSKPKATMEVKEQTNHANLPMQSDQLHTPVLRLRGGGGCFSKQAFSDHASRQYASPSSFGNSHNSHYLAGESGHITVLPPTPTTAQPGQGFPAGLPRTPSISPTMDRATSPYSLYPMSVLGRESHDTRR